jgi:hypothetical protein
MYIIWHDKDYDFARWIYSNSDISKSEEKTLLKPIPKTNAKSTILAILKDKSDFDILPIIKYETPDVIIQHVDEKTGKSKILLVTEFMTHTPQHHHPLQRFSRIYGSSALGIPVALVIPNRKIKLERKEGTYKPTSYKANPLIYHIFIRTTEINQTPTLIFFWPEREGYLKNDKKHPTAPFIDAEMEKWFELLNDSLKGIDLKNKNIQNKLKEMVEKSNYHSQEQMNLVKNWKDLYKLETIKIIPTKEAIKEFNLDKNNLTNDFLNRSLTLVFEPGGLRAPQTPFRTDPYAGMLCAFDNRFCRNDEGKRSVNLLLRAKNIKHSEVHFDTIIHKEEECPFLNWGISQELSPEQIANHLDNCPFTKSKQQRIYGRVSDVIVFDDHILYTGGKDD